MAYRYKTCAWNLDMELGHIIQAWNMNMDFRYGTWAWNLGMELEHGIQAGNSDNSDMEFRS